MAEIDPSDQRSIDEAIAALAAANTAAKVDDLLDPEFTTGKPGVYEQSVQLKNLLDAKIQQFLAQLTPEHVEAVQRRFGFAVGGRRRRHRRSTRKHRKSHKKSAKKTRGGRWRY